MSAMQDEDDSRFQAETVFDVRLYIYDISKGLASAFSSMFLGKQLPGIWHTSVVVYEREYFFGSVGIQSCIPGETILGEADQIVNLGKTEIPYTIFLEFVFSLGDSAFSPGTYDLFHHNCNNFTNEVSTFLVGKGIPKEIVDLPFEVLSTIAVYLAKRKKIGATIRCRKFFACSNLFKKDDNLQQSTVVSPLGQTLKTYLQSFDVRPQGTGVNLTGPELGGVRENQIKSQRDKRKNNRVQHNGAMGDSENVEVTEPESQSTASNDHQETKRSDSVKSDVDKDESEAKPVSGRKSYKYDDPPIIFRDVDGMSAIRKLSELINDLLSPEETKYLTEWQEYLNTDNGAWVLGTEHMDFISHLLNGGSSGKYAPNVPLLTLQVLQASALKEDFVLVLHQDRKDHRLMSYINRVENLTLAEQEEVIKLMCNLCSQPNSFDWLMYISEWTESDGQTGSNCRVTTRAAVHTLLNDKLTTLQRTGVNLIFNLALKELFEDTATELATAVLQFLHGELDENQIFLCLTALLRFMIISHSDVSALTKMLGPDLKKFNAVSERIDLIVQQINEKLGSSP